MLLLIIFLTHQITLLQTSAFSLDIFSSIAQFFQNLINAIFGAQSTIATTTVVSTTILRTAPSTASTTTSLTTTTMTSTIITQASNSQPNNTVNAPNGLGVNLTQLNACNTYSSCQTYCTNNPSLCSSIFFDSKMRYYYTLAQMNATAISSNPVNLSQLASYGFAISKYRSCAGHDFPGYNFNGTFENESSMKHYFSQITNVGNTSISNFHLKTISNIQLFAPFNGTIVYDAALPGTTAQDPGLTIVMSSAADPMISVTIFHINMLASLGNGSVVTGGQLLGYAAGGGGNFDISLGMTRQQGAPPCPESTCLPSLSILDSIFNHMTGSVLAQYQKYGITQNNIIFPWSARVAVPCNYPNDTRSSSSVGGPHQTALWNWINLTAH